MRAVNLLPRDDARTRRGLPSPWVLLSGAAPLVAGSLVYLGYSTEHAKVVEKRGELSAVQARVDKLTASLAGVRAQSGLVSQRASRQAALQDVLAKEFAWDVTLQDLARVLPKGIWLTSVTATSPTPANVAPVIAPPPAASASTGTTTTTTTTTPAPAAPRVNTTAFTIQGFAPSHDAVAELLARLSLMPMLGNVTLTSTATSQPAGGSSTTTGGAASAANPGPTLVQFQVTASINQFKATPGL